MAIIATRGKYAGGRTGTYIVQKFFKTYVASSSIISLNIPCSMFSSHLFFLVSFKHTVLKDMMLSSLMSPLSLLSHFYILLSFVLCLKSHISCFLSNISGLMSYVSCLISHVSCLLSCVSSLISHAFCLISQVSCLMSPVSYLMSPVFCLINPAICLMSHISYPMSPATCLLSHV